MINVERGLSHGTKVGGGIVQRKHSCFPPSNPRFESWLRQVFFSVLLSLWTILRLNPSTAKQWISQMQLTMTYRAKCYKKYFTKIGLSRKNMIRITRRTRREFSGNVSPADLPPDMVSLVSPDMNGPLAIADGVAPRQVPEQPIADPVGLTQYFPVIKKHSESDVHW